MSTSATILSSASAPGKVILAGEHAVVYGHPAIAAPVWQVAATCRVSQASTGAGCTLALPDVGVELRLADGDADHPAALLARRALTEIGAPANPDWQIEVSSTVPMAGGLGSGAALSSALVKAIWGAAGRDPDADSLSALVYSAEQAYHGTPSGIDNTVIAHGRTIWFVRGRPPIFLTLGAPMTLLIADSGVRSPTLETVGDVRLARERDPQRFDALFAQVAEVVHGVRAALEAGNARELGGLFTRNHTLLAQIGVSAPLLDDLVAAALQAGALGAKLSGGGRGGNVIALTAPERAEAVAAALTGAGAVRLIRTTLADNASEPSGYDQ
jgi:mevalonate kinase